MNLDRRSSGIFNGKIVFAEVDEDLGITCFIIRGFNFRREGDDIFPMFYTDCNYDISQGKVVSVVADCTDSIEYGHLYCKRAVKSN